MKIASNYNPALQQDVTFTICLMNATNAPKIIHEVDDFFEDAFFYTNCGADTAGISCDHALGNGGTLRWFADFTVPANSTVKLTVTGNYHASGHYCNDATKYTVLDANSVPISGVGGICLDVP